MIIFNWIGASICAVGFGLAFAFGHFIFHSTAEGLLMVMAGPAVAALDVLYRTKSENGHWLHPHGGGSLFFLPVWAFGIFWLVLGIVRITKGTG